MGFPQTVCVDSGSVIVGNLVPNSTASSVGLANLATIRAAMNSAPDGGTVIIPLPPSGGQFYIETDSATAFSPTKDLTLLGIGPYQFFPTVKLKFGPNDPLVSVNMFLTAPGVNFALENLWIEGPNTNNNGANQICCVKDTADLTTTAVDGGAGVTTIRRCAITRFTHGHKIQGDGVTVSTNRRLRLFEDYYKVYGNNGDIVVGILTDGGEVVVRDSIFDMQLAGNNGGTVNTASHNMYVNPNTAIDVQGSMFVEAAGYHINTNATPVGTPRWWRVIDNTFLGNPTGSIQTNQYAVSAPGVDSPVALISGNTFADSTGSGVTVNGSCHIVDNDFCGLRTGSASDIQTFSATTISTTLIQGNRFRNRIRIISPFVTFLVRNNRFVPSLAASGPSIVMTSAATGTPGSTIIAENNDFEGSAGATSQATIQGGTYISRRNRYHNKNNASQKLVITGSPTGGTFTLSFGGNTTTPISWRVGANTILTALAALASIGTGNITVTPIQPNSTNTGVLPGCAMEITFINGLGAAAQSLITGDASGLTGGTVPAVTCTSVVTGGSITTAAIIIQNAGTVITGGGDSFDEVDVFDIDSKAFSISASATGTYQAQHPGQFGAAIASASTINLPFSSGLVHITGTTTINTLNVVNSGTLAGVIGTTIYLIFDSTAALGITGNIANAFSGSAGAVKMLIWDGTKWQG